MIQGKKKSSCSYCGLGMRVSAMECPGCNVEIRASFQSSLLAMLGQDEQELLEQYMLAEFSIKALAERTDMGYAAIRTRLDRLISSYKSLKAKDQSKKQILDKVASGELSARQGAEMIKNLGES